MESCRGQNQHLDYRVRSFITLAYSSTRDGTRCCVPRELVVLFSARLIQPGVVMISQDSCMVCGCNVLGSNIFICCGEQLFAVCLVASSVCYIQTVHDVRAIQSTVDQKSDIRPMIVNLCCRALHVVTFSQCDPCMAGEKYVLTVNGPACALSLRFQSTAVSRCTRSWRTASQQHTANEGAV